MVAKLTRVSRSLIVADEVSNVKPTDKVLVGDEGLVGEVLSVSGRSAFIQIYEDSAGLKQGDRVSTTSGPITVSLGPGLLGGIFDGLQRPLTKIRDLIGTTLGRGLSIPALDEDQRWEFVPLLSEGDEVNGGDIIGTVAEQSAITHKIMLPHNVSGVIENITQCTVSVYDVVCTIKTADDETVNVTMIRDWPIRTPRPVSRKLPSATPLYTGQRIFDSLFPITKGGSAALIGPPGSGKTVAARQLSKYSETDVVVFVTCGGRGTEIADIISEFEELSDRHNSFPLIERSVIIANTTDMPIAARESAVYTGTTIAEYYRDMGYDVLLMIDSISSWAEAMRLLSDEIGFSPAEGGYPPYLNTRIAQLFERGGYVECCGSDSRRGSLTIAGVFTACSDKSPDPAIHAVKRVTGTILNFDLTLAAERHFPSVDWLDSYLRNTESIKSWYDKAFGSDFFKNTGKAFKLLRKEAELFDIQKHFGKESMSASDRLSLHCAKMIREDFLQQDAQSTPDCFSTYEKQATLLSLILYYHDLCADALSRRITDVSVLFEIPALSSLAKAKMLKPDECEEKFNQIAVEIEQQISLELQRQLERKEISEQNG